MAKITFKGKLQTMYSADDTVAYQYITVPAFARSHCDMRAFRVHPKYGSYANSDLFTSILARIRKEIFNTGILKLNAVPNIVSVDSSKFLTVVTFEV